MPTKKRKISKSKNTKRAKPREHALEQQVKELRAALKKSRARGDAEAQEAQRCRAGLDFVDAALGDTTLYLEPREADGSCPPRSEIIRRMVAKIDELTAKLGERDTERLQE